MHSNGPAPQISPSFVSRHVPVFMAVNVGPCWLRWFINGLSFPGGIALIAFGVCFTFRCAYGVLHRTPLLQLVGTSEFNQRLFTMYLLGSLFWLIGIVLAGLAARDTAQLLSSGRFRSESVPIAQSDSACGGSVSNP